MLKRKRKTWDFKDTLPVPTREELHRHYGGIIYASDFHTNYAGNPQSHSFVASRIVSDESWEKSLQKHKEMSELYAEKKKIICLSGTLSRS